MGFFATKQEKLNKRLRKAVDKHNLGALEEAIAEGADVNHIYPKWTNPLYSSVYEKFSVGVRTLLEHGANPDILTLTSKLTPLMLAASRGEYESAELLIQHKANLDMVDSDGKTALHKAAAEGHGAIVRLLMQHGAKVDITDNRMDTPADLADRAYPRVADLIRGKKREEEKAEAPDPQLQDDSWRLTAPDEVSSVSEKPDIGYRLTEIFNFGAGIYTRIAHNMRTGAESQSVRFFDEFSNRSAIDRAREELVRLGGAAAEEASKLGKPQLARPQGTAP